MRRLTRVLVVVAIAAAGLIGVQQPAGAVTQAAMIGGGWMGAVSGPGLTASPVTGTISGTAVGTFGTCSFSDPFNGMESILQGQGGGSLGCWAPCSFWYQRVAHEIVMNGACGWFGSTFQVAGFAEPNSVAPTTSYLFQVTGTDSFMGPIVIQGNMAFSPGVGVGVDPGTLLQTPTSVSFNGSLTGLLGTTVGTCNLNMFGSGNESITIGQTALSGTCTGPGVSASCNIMWTHLGTQTAVNGTCAGSLGFQVVGLGVIVLGAGGSYSFFGEVTII